VGLRIICQKGENCAHHGIFYFIPALSTSRRREGLFLTFLNGNIRELTEINVINLPDYPQGRRDSPKRGYSRI